VDRDPGESVAAVVELESMIAHLPPETGVRVYHARLTIGEINLAFTPSFTGEGKLGRTIAVRYEVWPTEQQINRRAV
jgi:hypothetical protein